MRTLSINLLGLSPTILLLASSALHAQIDEILVTAQMREQPIQEVPVAVTSLSGEFMAAQRLYSLESLGDVTPGLLIQEQSPNNPGYVIRGISTDEGSPVDAARISMFLNGADISRNRGSLIELYDIARVEVVKGPQATLFGTAASGGAISISTALPQQEFGASYRFELGNYGYRRIEGMVTGGSDLVQGRLAFMTSHRDGYVDNLTGAASAQNFSASPNSQLMARERFSIRPSLSFTPGESTRIDLILTREQNRDSGTAFKSAVYAPTGGDTNPFSFAELSGSNPDAGAFKGRDLGIWRNTSDVNLTIEHQLSENWTMKSISNLREFDSYEILDADGSQAVAFELAEDATGNQLSQEFRFQFQSDSLDLTLGGTWFQEEGYRSVPFSAEEGTFMLCVPPALTFATQIELQIIGQGGPDLGLDEMSCLNPDGSVNSLTPIVTPYFTGYSIAEINYNAEFSAYSDNSAWSLFGDASWSLSDRLELVAGVRYVNEDRRSFGSSNVPNAQLTGGLVPLVFVDDTGGARIGAGNSGSDTLPRAALNYQLDNRQSLYLSVSKGRRAPVTDVTPALDPTTFQPLNPVSHSPAEILWNYETGLRGHYFDDQLYLSLSLFRQEYENFQVQTLTGAGQFITSNAGTATNEGAELEVRWSPDSRLKTFLNYAFIDAGIDDDPANATYAGKRFRLQPENTAALGYQWRSSLNDRLDLVSSGRVSYRDEVFFDVTYQPVEPVSGLRLADDPVSLVSASIGIASTDDRWRLELFADNLTDQEYLVDAGNTGASVGIPTVIPGAPRFLGLGFSSYF